MKDLKEHIFEKLKISNKPGYTLRNFVEWYINETPGGELTVNDIRSLDFNRSPSKTWRMFDMSSVNIAKFLLNYLDDYIDLTEDINKEEKSITYTFYIDDILFVVLAVYNTRTKYPAFFDQYVNESLVSEKLKVRSSTIDDVSDLTELGDAYSKWLKKQNLNYKTIKIKNIYRSAKIALPKATSKTGSEYNLSEFYVLKFSSKPGAKATLRFEGDNRYLIVDEEFTVYDELIERLGNGNYADGEVIYDKIIQFLNKN